MKVILSRKGFDASNGGCPSPILPDGTLLSLPIPSDNRDTYEDLSWQGIDYAELLRQLRPGKAFSQCHVDPDLRPGLRTAAVEDWKPAFGQIDAAQGVLTNAGVEKGDLFLFFGWFRQTESTADGYRFLRKGADLHVIYGYLQIGEILTEPAEIAKYSWHPHASEEFLKHKANALYLPMEHLSWNPALPGYGTLRYVLPIDQEFTARFTAKLRTLYPTLPRQIIHRDPNPGNILLSSGKWGFIDFELSERNVRIYDPCYAAMAILSETCEDGNEEKLDKWTEILREIMCGYDAAVKLSDMEKEVIPDLLLANQLIATAWFYENTAYRKLYETNANMTVWLLRNYDRIQESVRF